MTWALCFNCGAVKFGAICPCPECQVASTGDWGIDIAFSDHHMSWASLRALGAVVRSIREVCDDDRVRNWAFVYYVAKHHPQVLDVQLEAGLQEQCEALLARLDLPSFTIESLEESMKPDASKENGDP